MVFWASRKLDFDFDYVIKVSCAHSSKMQDGPVCCNVITLKCRYVLCCFLIFFPTLSVILHVTQTYEYYFIISLSMKHYSQAREAFYLLWYGQDYPVNQGKEKESPCSNIQHKHANQELCNIKYKYSLSPQMFLQVSWLKEQLEKVRNHLFVSPDCYFSS